MTTPFTSSSRTILVGMFIVVSLFLSLGTSAFAQETGVTDEEADEQVSRNVDTYVAGVCAGKTGDAKKACEQNARATVGQEDGNPFNCSFIPMRMGECIGSMVYYLLFIPAGYFLGFAGTVFDVFAAFTLSPVVMDADFVPKGWAGVRDIANMAFIFALLAIAIATILRVESHSAKQVLARLIIVALVVNFSLFVSRVIIDAGNVSALFFYDRIDDRNVLKGVAPGAITPEKFLENPNALGVKVKSISVLITASVKPQAVFSDRTALVEAVKNKVEAVILLFLGTAIIYVAMALTFLSITLTFLTRVALLWLLMVVSPLAFAAMILPSTAGYAKKWWGEIFSKAFCVAVFMFFIYLIVLFTSGAFFPNTFAPLGRPGSSTGSIIFFLILFGLYVGVIFVLLTIAKKVTVKMCDTLAGQSVAIGKGLGKVFGTAAGLLALGPLAGLGRAIVGRGAARLLGSDGVKDWAGKSGAVGRFAVQGLRGVAGASFDARNTLAGKYLGLKGGGSGGYEGKVAKELAKERKFAEYLGKGAGGAKRKKEYAEYLANKYSGDTFMNRRVRKYAGVTAHGAAQQRIAAEITKGMKPAELNRELGELSRQMEGLKRELHQQNGRITEHAAKRGTMGDGLWQTKQATLEKERFQMEKRLTQKEEQSLSKRFELDEERNQSLVEKLTKRLKEGLKEGDGTKKEAPPPPKKEE